MFANVLWTCLLLVSFSCFMIWLTQSWFICLPPTDNLPHILSFLQLLHLLLIWLSTWEFLLCYVSTITCLLLFPFRSVPRVLSSSELLILDYALLVIMLLSNIAIRDLFIGDLNENIYLHFLHHEEQIFDLSFLVCSWSLWNHQKLNRTIFLPLLWV